MKEILLVLGTRPEAIKLAPLVLHMRERSREFDACVCATGQHREMLDQVFELFGLRPDVDLAVMRPGQTLFGSTSAILGSLEGVLSSYQPDMIVVQGDTTSTLCGALAGLFGRVPVAHVEAGLRTGDFDHPFPEEANRALVGRIAKLHLAATEGAANNLRAEGIREGDIVVTGNSGIDAVMWVRNGLEAGAIESGLKLPEHHGRRLITVTLHRRENHGGGLAEICQAIESLALSRDDVQFVFPVHPNPAVKGPVESRLGGIENVALIAPLGYVAFVDLMRRSYLLLTDSGGIQEEAPSLGKPVLVMREKTERPEAAAAGTARLVGSDYDRICREVSRLLDCPQEYAQMASVRNPYGDGHASVRIADAIAAYFGLGPAGMEVAGLRSTFSAGEELSRCLQ